MNNLEGIYSETSRGFPLIKFQDSNGNQCSLQCSSAILCDEDLENPGTSAVWLGVDGRRMHLDREKVKGLIYAMQQWLDSGYFE